MQVGFGALGIVGVSLVAEVELIFGVVFVQVGGLLGWLADWLLRW